MEIIAIGLACFALGVGLTSLIYVMFLGPGSKDYPCRSRNKGARVAQRDESRPQGQMDDTVGYGRRQTQELQLSIDGKAIAKAAFGATGDRPEGKCY